MSDRSATAADNSARLVRILDDYLAQAAQGRAPDKSALLARHADLAADLEACLASLEFIGQAADTSPPLTAAEAIGPATRTLGDFQIVREVGRGGMGVVYEARQLSLDRRVALKVLPFAGMLDRRQLQRFKNEAQAAAQLDHPHIVDVIAVGCERAVHYYAMRFIEGRTLAQAIDELRHAGGRRGALESQEQSAAKVVEFGPKEEQPLELNPSTLGHGLGAVPITPVERREYFRSVALVIADIADALDHAHQVGVIHRDVKPSNILLDSRGAAWITDFGLAQFETGTQMTSTGDLLGTLAYMSPEQAAGQRQLLDHRTDVYSLGATLYELLALQPPFAGPGRAALVQKILEETPRRPVFQGRPVPEELAIILQKALEKSPADRYGTAGEMAADLRRYLRDEPIRARPLSARQRAIRWTQRHVGLAYSIGAAIMIALIASTTAAVVVYRSNRVMDAALEDSRQQRRLAVEQRIEAETQRKVADQRSAQAEEQRGLAERRRVDAEEQRKNADEQRRLADERSDQAELLAAQLLMNEGQSLCEQGEIGRGLVRMAQSIERAPSRFADFQHAARTNWAAWKARVHTLRSVIQHGQGAIQSVAFSPDGKLLATAGDDGIVRLWNPSTGEKAGPELRHSGKVNVVMFSPDSQVIYTAGADRTARRFTIATGEPIGEPLVHPYDVRYLVVSRDGSRIATACGTFANVWDAQSGERIGPPRNHPRNVVGLSFGASAAHLLTCTDGKECAHLWDVQTGERAALDARLEQPEPLLLKRLTHLGDGRRFWGLTNRGIYVWDAASYKLSAHGLEAWSETGPSPPRIIASADGAFVIRPEGRYRRAHVAAMETMTLLGQPLQHSADFVCSAVSADSSLAATGDREGTARVWSLAPRRQGGRLLVHDGEAPAYRQSAFNRDGTELITVGQSPRRCEVQVRDAATGELLKKVVALTRGVGDQAWSTLFSLDGQSVGLLGAKDMLAVKLSGEGTDKLVVLDAKLAIPRGQLSPQGNVLVAFSQGQLIAWEIPSGELKWKRLLEGGIFWHLSISPDGAAVLTGSSDRTARLWDLSSGEPLGPPFEHDDIVSSAAFLPDGRIATCTTSKGDLRFWDVKARQQIGEPLQTGQKAPWIGRPALIASPAGGSVATITKEGTLRLWDVVARRQVGESVGGVQHATYTPDGSQLLAFSKGAGAIRIVDSANGKPIPLKSMEPGFGVWNHDVQENRLLTASEDEVCMWDFKSGEKLGDSWTADGSIIGAKFLPDERKLVLHVASWPETVVYRWTRDGAMISQRVLDRSHAWAVAVPAERPIVATAWKNELSVRHRETGEVQARLTLPTQDSSGPRALLSRNGNCLLATGGKTAVLYNAETWKPHSPPLVHSDAIGHAAVSDDGSHALVGCHSGDIYVWRCANGRSAGPVLNLRGFANALALSPSCRLAAAGVANTVAVWEVATGRAVFTILDAGMAVSGLAFTGDESLLYVASSQTVQAYSVPTGSRIGPLLASPRKRPTGRRGGIVLSHDDSLLHAYETDDTSMLWSLASPVGISAGEIVAVTAAITGLRPGENNAIDVIDAAAWRSLRHHAD